MTYVLQISPAIADDVAEAVDYYAGIAPNLVLRFVEDLERTLRLIESYPLTGRSLYGDVRRMVFETFPYLLTYRIDRRHIRVQLLVHTRRNPGWIRQTIRDRS